MSAAAVVQAPGMTAAAARSKFARGFVRVRSSFLRGLPRVLTNAQLRCVWYVLSETVGAFPVLARCAIDWDALTEMAVVSRRECEAALSYLVNEGVLLRTGVGGAKLYSVAVRAQEGGEVVRGKCRSCEAVGEIDLDDDWRPVPRTFFRNALAACGHAEAVCLAVILERTVSWSREERDIAITPAEISLDDFARCTGLGRSSLSRALDELLDSGFIAETKTAGCPSLFAACPAAFQTAGRREARLVRQPARREREQKAKSEAPENAETIESTELTGPVEFVSAAVGICRACGSYGAFDLVEAPASGSNAVPHPAAGKAGTVARSRAGPSAPLHQPIPADLSQVEAYLRGLPFAEAPDAVAVREVGRALGDAPVRLLHERYLERREYLAAAGSPYMVLAAIARSIGAKWREGAAERASASLRQADLESRSAEEWAAEVERMRAELRDPALDAAKRAWNLRMIGECA